MYLINFETWLDPAIARFLQLEKLVGPLYYQQMAIATHAHLIYLESLRELEIS